MPPGYQPRDLETCDHCGTPTRRGCSCADCFDSADDIPPDVIYHSKGCDRWWAYMLPPRITTITFGEPEGGRQ